MIRSVPGSVWGRLLDLDDHLGRAGHRRRRSVPQDDPDGLRQLMDAVDLLADQPRPPGSAEYGSPNLRRMHVGRYRVMYEITEATVTIVVIHIGRTG